MTITVQIPTALRRLTAGVSQSRVGRESSGTVFRARRAVPRADCAPAGRTGQIRRFLNVYVNEEDIRFLGGPSIRFRKETKSYSCPQSPAARASCHPEPALSFALRNAMRSRRTPTVFGAGSCVFGRRPSYVVIYPKLTDAGSSSFIARLRPLQDDAGLV